MSNLATSAPASIARVSLAGGGGRTAASMLWQFSLNPTNAAFAATPVAGTDGDRLVLFDTVRLLRDVTSEGERIPAGAAGTIVDVFDGGRAFNVEFVEPTDPTSYPPVVTIYRTDLVRDFR